MAHDFSFTVSADGVQEISFVPTGQCAGLQVLLQRVIFFLFSNPNDPLRYEGANLYGTLSSANLTKDDLDRIRNLLKITLAEAAEQIMAAQATISLPDEELLSTLALEDVALEGADGLNVVLRVVSKAGESAAANLNLEL
jgi:hypothetical protein